MLLLRATTALSDPASPPLQSLRASATDDEAQRLAQENERLRQVRC